ncbi:MAG: hypothetical protein V4675_08635 [Verrucomicrobiota bacterium]
MKRFLPILLVVLALAVCFGFYYRGWQQERRLTGEGSRLPGRVASAGTGAMSAHPAATDKSNPDLGGWTPLEAAEFIEHWIAEAHQAEQALIVAGGNALEKLASYDAHLKTLSPEELLAICLTAAADTYNLTIGSMDWQSSDTEMRRLLQNHAYNELIKQNPFLALRIPHDQTHEYNGWHESHALGECARIDPEATWRIVGEKYHGKDVGKNILDRVLRGAAGDDIAARFDCAREWGVLGRVAGEWADDASKTPSGQNSWLEVVRETSPPDKEVQLAKFAKEVETSQGFEGVQRLIGRIAEPGTALYDTILREAAGRDLEEAAGPKADWILAQVSPAAAVATAETLMKQWTETDPLSASEWLDVVPRLAPWRRAAILAFVKGIERHDPEAAAQWRLAAGAP